MTVYLDRYDVLHAALDCPEFAGPGTRLFIDRDTVHGLVVCADCEDQA